MQTWLLNLADLNVAFGALWDTFPANDARLPQFKQVAERLVDLRNDVHSFANPAESEEVKPPYDAPSRFQATVKRNSVLSMIVVLGPSAAAQKLSATALELLGTGAANYVMWASAWLERPLDMDIAAWNWPIGEGGPPGNNPVNPRGRLSRPQVPLRRRGQRSGCSRALRPA